jgi:hypothetical protein
MASNKNESRLAASALSAEGFLGSDTRPFERIIADDAKAIESAGISLSALAAALEQVYCKARDNLGAPLQVRSGVRAVFYESMGRIPSPFGDGFFEKGEAVVADEQGTEKLIITSLSIHLIRKHGFFQGKGSRYRIDPVAAAKLLL